MVIFFFPFSMVLIYPLSISSARQMSPCDIPFRVRIFLMFFPSFSLINISTVYEILHLPTILHYNSRGSGGTNQKFPFLHFRLSAGVRGSRKEMEGNFWV